MSLCSRPETSVPLQCTGGSTVPPHWHHLSTLTCLMQPACRTTGLARAVLMSRCLPWHQLCSHASMHAVSLAFSHASQ